MARLFALALAAGLAATLPDVGWAQVSLSTAINKSGRMRMLSQRIIKAQAQYSHGILIDRASDVLRTSVREMGEGLDDLKRLQPNAEIRSTYAQLEAKARPFLAAAAVVAKLDAPRLAALNAQADEVLDLAHKLTGQYEQAGKAAGAKLINVAGRQRMLSQRMSKNYFLIHAAVPGVTQAEIARDQKEFVSALAMLKAAPLTNAPIKQDLDLADVQWVFFENALGVKTADRSALQNVATTSERILEVMDDLTLQYDQALKDLL
jgi:nitrate/nitrite-specific signal transduction histidine kinase